MNYRVEVSDEGKWVEITVDAPVTAEDTKDFSAEAIALAKEKDILNILVDVSGYPNMTKTIDQYEFAYHYLEHIGMSKNLRVGVIVDPGDSSHDFIGTVLRNAGFNCQFFPDRKHATAWFEPDEGQ